MNEKLTFNDIQTKSLSTLERGDWLAVKLVIAIGYAYDYAAYIGPSDWPDEKVKKDGRKLTRAEAPKLYLFEQSGMSYRH